MSCCLKRLTVLFVHKLTSKSDGERFWGQHKVYLVDVVVDVSPADSIQKSQVSHRFHVDAD